MHRKLISILEKSLNLPKYSSFEEFLISGINLNKEDRFAELKVEFTPWMKTVARWLESPDVEWVYLIQGSQTGKTTLQMAYLLYVSQQEPCRIIWVQSTEEEAKQFITTRLKPYIDGFDSEAISKKAWRTEAFKVFKARVKVAFATTEQSLKTVPAKYTFGDECAMWKYSIDFVKKRTRTFAGVRKGIFATTPPREIEHFSWVEAKSANFYRWYVPCPKCGEYQPLILKGLKWPEKEKGYWNYLKIKEGTKYQCAFCGDLWPDTQEFKIELINKGKAVCVNPNEEYKECEENKANTSRTLQVSALYSVFTKWGDLAVDFLNAKHKGYENLRIFITDELAEVPQKQQGEEVLKSDLKVFVDKNRESGMVEGYDLYTGGVDLQALGDLYYCIVGWKSGITLTGHVLKYGKVRWKNEDGMPMWENFIKEMEPFRGSLYQVALDSSYGPDTPHVYTFVNWAGPPFIALKETPISFMKVLYKNITIDPNTKQRSVFGQRLMEINSHLIKDEIAASLKRAPGEIGAWSFPSDTTEEFLKHIKNEHRIEKIRHGRKVWIWEPRYAKAPQHWFSALVYATACSEDMRMQLQMESHQELNKQKNESEKWINVDNWRIT